MSDPALPAYINYFLDPSHYDHPVDKVDLVQTHISYVLLAGDFVYKFKKPVDFGFLDFTSLAKRQHFVEEELRLNRRLCPDIYLTTLAVTREGNGFALAGSGEVEEYGLKMKRMPEEGMMAEVIGRGELTEDSIDAIVQRLVPFYAAAAVGPEIQGFGKAESVAVNVLENFEQTEGFISDDGPLSQEQFAEISSYAKGFLAREEIFTSRLAQVRDCHGDLYSANICLAPDQVYIFDCIEFNERFRYHDVASDVAFLAMDLDFRGLTDLSSYFIESFVARSGDEGLREVLNFYKCYRAYVRGKIGLFTAHAPEVDGATQAAALDAAAKYFGLAHSYAKS
ncbi:MAG: hypothetical protein ABFR97_00155 [Thermodesulfobacteriota bacterium]